MFDFTQQRGLPFFVVNRLANMAVKVTIRTFGYTKGPVNIKRQGFGG